MISIILPAYNEEKNIAPAIDDISNFLREIGEQFEIIVVNDGSQDGTGKILEEYRKNNNVAVITHPKNLGYGAALRSGFNKAAGDLIFFTDSDRQFDIRELGLFLKNIGNYDFIIGYRQIRKDHALRIFNTWVFHLIAQFLFGIKVKDVDCAFKLFKARALKNLPLFSSGALISLEIFVQAKKRNYKFIEFSVKHFPRRYGKQTGANIKVLFKAFFGLFSLWLKTR